MLTDEAPIRYAIPRFYLWSTVVGALIVTGVGTVGLLIATVVGSNAPPVPFTGAFVLGSGAIWYGVLMVFVIEIIVWPNDGRVVFRCLATKRQTYLGDIEAISRPPITLRKRGNAVTVRYRGGTAYVLKYLDWSDFIGRVREQNQRVEVSGF